MTMSKTEAFVDVLDLPTQLSEDVGKALSHLGLNESAGRVIVSDRPDLCDFQTNAALALAKAAKANPRELAQKLIDRVKDNPKLSAIDMAGPGFVNFVITDAALADQAMAISQDSRLGAPKVAAPRKVLIDFGGPNVAKEMHIGHLRTAVIGECLKRVFRFMGDEVIGDAHFGDWGYQMGLLIVALRDEKPDLCYFADLPPHDWPKEAPVTLDDLQRLYPLASARGKSDESFRDAARKATKALQDGHEAYRILWGHFVKVSREALIRDYSALGVSFDWWKGESDADPYIAPMLMDLRDKGLLVPDQGAEIIHVARDDDKGEIRPMLVVSSEGSSMYATTDLATIKQRQVEFGPDLVLYCVDQRQANHFVQVFRAAYLAGYAHEGQLEHAANGTVNGPDGTPFKTRDGGTLKLHELISQATDKATQRLTEAGATRETLGSEFDTTAHKVAIAALKFAELSNHRLTNYIFDLDRFTSFEGKTGPYILYQAVRMKAILTKAHEAGLVAGAISIGQPAERDLVLRLDGFAESLKETYLKRAPNLLAEHVYRLAQDFSKFYAACPVLGDNDQTIISSRLALVHVCLKQLELGLDLMGLSAPSVM